MWGSWWLRRHPKDLEYPLELLIYPRNTDYCKYCFPNGNFGKDETMEEMIESCIPFWVGDGECKTPEEARERMRELFPTLKRWKNQGSPQ